MLEPLQIAEDTYMISWGHDVPGHGILPVNSLVIMGPNPLLVDTGAPAYRTDYLDAVFSLVEPEDVKWIFLSHEDADHSGNLLELLQICPNAKVLTSFLAVGKLGFSQAPPIDRVVFFNKEETFDIGDRKIVAVRPPLFDSPTTRGMYDPKMELYWAADAFGAVIPKMYADIRDVAKPDFEEGFYWFNRINHCWFELTDQKKMDREVNRIRQLNAKILVGGHGPAGYNMNEQLCDMIEKIPGMEPVHEPTQAELEAILHPGA